MSQIQYEASGSEVSRVESDIAQTINLADTVVNLIREPIVLLYQNISKTKALNASLGLWKGEALDDAGHCRIPVIQENSFEAYLVREDGVIDCFSANGASLKPQERRIFRRSWGNNSNLSQDQRPQTPPPGSACWAYFVHSLGIRPGMGVLEWRPSTDGYISTQNGGVEMEIDGSVLCHIINLYSILPRPNREGKRVIRIQPNLKEASPYTFSFGELAWDTVNGQLHAHFTPGVITRLNAAKKPFEKGKGHMEPGTMMMSYFMALDHGASDSEFHLLPPGASLKERVSKLISCVQQLTSKKDGLLLLSSEWVENASRIRQRVLTQGGEDYSFYQDICKTLELVPYDGPQENEIKEKEIVRRKIGRIFPSRDDHPWSCIRPGPHGDPSNELSFIGTREVIRKTLDGYSDHSPGSWKRQLFEMKDEVIQLMKISQDVVVGENVHVLRFTKSSDLWDKKVLLGAPIAPLQLS